LLFREVSSGVALSGRYFIIEDEAAEQPVLGRRVWAIAAGKPSVPAPPGLHASRL